MQPVRTRFAPSPTGFLHIGGARTALFNWLYARAHGGQFLLRIEDTDRQRHVEAGISAILDGLRWLGLDWDEGPEIGGDRAPYFQSERTAIYDRHLAELDKKGHLYPDPANGAIRFRSPRVPITVHDLVCGDVTFERNDPDMTIRRPDGSYIFHFVNVVDDLEMGVTHVIRGEDHLSNTPKHIELFNAIGAEPPKYSHIPLILNRNGSKMSKRDAGAHLSEYREQGYDPAAVVNYLCLLGWSPKDNREKVSLKEILALFRLEHINRKNAHFDLDKLFWLNGEYIREMTLDEFRAHALPPMRAAGIQVEEGDYLNNVLHIVKEKVKLFSQLPAWTSYFFTEDFPYDEAGAKKHLSSPASLELLRAVRDALATLDDWTHDPIGAVFLNVANTRGVKPAAAIHPARMALTGQPVGPSAYHLVEVMGRDRVIARLDKALDKFQPAAV